MTSGLSQASAGAPPLRASRLDFTALELHQAMDLGLRLRERAAGAGTVDDVAQQLVEILSSALEHRGGAAFALVRTYVTVPGGLRLAATRGVPPAESASAEGYAARALAWPDAGALRRDAFFAEFFRQVGLGVETIVGSRGDRAGASRAPLRAFHLAVARGSPFVPAQDYVTAHAVASAFGFAAVLPTGDLFVTVILSKATIETATAELFEVFSLATKVALLDCSAVRDTLGEGARAAAKAEVLDRTLTEVQRRLAAQRGREAARESSPAGAGTPPAATGLEAQNRRLQRTQRAMLNVVEDLRHARGALEVRVAERTQELVRANDALKARNEELQEFVYIASHDLQEPLRTISGYLQMIERRYQGKLGSDADEFIHFAIDGARRMQELLESLLDYSRVATKRHSLEPLRLDDALNLALENLAFGIEETGAHIERGVLPLVTADRTQMVQLFQNLLSNALKFHGEAPPRVFVTSEREGHFWRIDVRDEGVGFNPRYADRIFKLFRRLQRGTPGTGIGLSICKKIVERHGGSIGATSEKGAGSTFHFLLPIPPEPEPSP